MNRLYDGKKTQVRQQAPTRDYWKNPEEFARGAGRETWMKMFELDAERDALLRALGIEPDIRKNGTKHFNEFDQLLDFRGAEGQVVRHPNSHI